LVITLGDDLIRIFGGVASWVPDLDNDHGLSGYLIDAKDADSLFD